MLKRCIKFELKRAFCEKNFYISLIIGLSIVILDLVTFYLEYHNSDNLLIQAWIGTDFQFAYNSLFYLLLPIMACAAYGGSYHTDCATCYHQTILVRVPKKIYIIAKGIAIYVAGFVAVAMPLGLNLFVMAGLFQNGVPNRLDFSSASILDCRLFPILFAEHPAIYCLVYIVIGGLFAGGFALISFGLSRWCRSSFGVIMLPFVIYVCSDIFVDLSNERSIVLSQLVNPLQPYITTEVELILLYGLLLFIGIWLIWKSERKSTI